MSRLARIVKYKRFYITTIGLFLADLLTKLWIQIRIPEYTYYDPTPIPIIPGFFYLVHIYNEGAAWGLFSGYGSWLAAFGALALICIYLLRKELELHRASVQCAIGLLCGGIIGNIYDRIAYGHVIDFLDVHLPGYRWPAFNVADCGITVGVTLYVIISISDLFRKGKKST
tara:strand:+ start:6141 stop:6653 length:513 start_codon:yes stop_codon:yes gene_type:complete